MALVKEIMGRSMIEKPPFLPSNTLKTIHHNQNLLSVNPVSVRRRISVVKAAISEDLAKFVKAEKPVTFKARAVLTVRNKHQEDFKETIVKKIDAFTDQIGRNVVLELYSTDIDPKTRAPKKSKEAVLKDWSQKSNLKSERVNYTSDLLLDSDFGIPGAITITNKHQKEFYLESITIEGFACGPVYFPCNSWVQSTNDHPNPRVFFSNQPYLPDETPAGLKLLREKELRDLRGDGKGVRKLSDRVYDYDVYNDLGNPDRGNDFIRPLLGGEKIPYPRRCRTGRLPTDTDILAESRVEKPFPLYVPRDEQFEESKQNAFSTGRLKAVLHNLLPSMVASISKKHDFKGFSQIESLYSEGLPLKLGLQDDLLKKLRLPNLVTRLHESSQGGGLLKYDTPKILSKDKFSWLRDYEFGRQALAGVNPVNIEKLKVFPPVSQLDPEIYGQQESALKEEHISGYLNGMSVQQAMEENKLFIIDYHDTYLPFLDHINSLDGRKAYATRTIFYLTQSGTLKPVAIELSLPRALPGSRSKRVVTPPVDATSNWTWQLAKAHVCSNDAGVHQLANHWLRTHAAMEPFILSAHRQLSAMHPIFKLLDPHMRYTLEINALARQNLINADGVIEQCFTPGRYCMEISAAAYKHWRFDLEGLPSDLIRRGMAVSDPSQRHGLKLLIKDYPYANDGLLIWEAIQKWVRTYVTRYYPDPSLVCNDRELQAWYAESINVGHADLRHENWWPELATGDDLTAILTTIIWLASAQHAALNFGQYPYGGYVPNRPPLMRRLIPDEHDPAYMSFLDDPQKFFLSALPSMLQSTKYMAVVDTLSTHSPDEEYIGERQQRYTWTGDADMVEAFDGFSTEIQRIEKEIERRNRDMGLKNRCGAGVLPYELLAPGSQPGVTCRGVPNSVSI
ncbi:lipoxygenase 1, chloroplastic [Lactuca sativa]|uniref:lipoxygenase 1, chloroplastic n=1 Tax=Lactuca sativa TaxID=4236 RepID=UPI000CB87F8C|nr:lipoxygenase 1, chloroplastic [Lactuca sativa]